MKDRDAVIVSAVRTPMGSKKGLLSKSRSDDMLAVAFKAALERVPQFDDWKMIDDITAGTAFPEAEQGMNLGRISGLLAGIPEEVPAHTVSRMCGSAMTGLHYAAMAIQSGAFDVVLEGGVESMTLVPMTSNKPTPNIRFIKALYGEDIEGIELPEVLHNPYMGMGETAENIIDRYGDKYDITRQSMDEFAFNSHQRALKAQEEGKFDDEIVPVIINPKTGDVEIYREEKGIPEGWVKLDKDEGPRKETTVEVLGKLRPVFRKGGRVTAGNSSPINAGAQAMLIMSYAKAKELGLEPLARIAGVGVAGLDPEIMGLGPIYSTQDLMKRYGYTIKDFQLAEVNEAFAAQSIPSVKELGLDFDIVNVNGGAISLGHPLGESGPRITTTLLYEMRRRNLNLGVASMCIGGGMGIATAIEIER